VHTHHEFLTFDLDHKHINAWNIYCTSYKYLCQVKTYMKWKIVEVLGIHSWAGFTVLHFLGLLCVCVK
jgi:hypothetical protein